METINLGKKYKETLYSFIKDLTLVIPENKICKRILDMEDTFKYDKHFNNCKVKYILHYKKNY